MSYTSDFKSAPFALFGVNGGNTSSDISLATLVGASFQSEDGREFTLVQNAGTALAAGLLVQGPAFVANHIDCAVATAATGATSITVTLGATSVVANQYAGGFATVEEGTAIGEMLKIASHPAATASGSLVITLEDPISTTLTSASSKVSLTLNPYGTLNGTDYTTFGVIPCPTGVGGITGQIIGATFYPIAASTATVASYGWIITKGLAPLLSDGGGTAGLGVMNGTTTVGAVSTVVSPVGAIGQNYNTAVNTKVGLVNINL